MGYTYTDRPVFGFDIGRSSLKIMQVQHISHGKAKVIGYGSTTFDPNAVDKGMIVNFEQVASATKNLFDSQFTGALTTKRVAFAIPNEHSFSRVLTLPLMNPDEMQSAVYAEANKAIPIPNENLYIDYEIGSKMDNDMYEVQLVATRREIVDSFVTLSEILGLEIALVETNISAVSRIVTHAEKNDAVSLIIDLGSTVADLSVYDGTTVRITSTADCSGDRITSLIAKKLTMSTSQAHTVKTRYGIDPSKRQNEILSAIKPELDKLIAEVSRIVRYYEDRAPKTNPSIGQIIMLGGGANLPGISTYITDQIRIPTRLCDPWQNISFGGLQSPHHLETTLYTTAAGLSLVNPEEISR